MNIIQISFMHRIVSVEYFLKDFLMFDVPPHYELVLWIFIVFTWILWDDMYYLFLYLIYIARKYSLASTYSPLRPLDPSLVQFVLSISVLLH